MATEKENQNVERRLRPTVFFCEILLFVLCRCFVHLRIKARLAALLSYSMCLSLVKGWPGLLYMTVLSIG